MNPKSQGCMAEFYLFDFKLFYNIPNWWMCWIQRGRVVLNLF